ncbi:M23 family metallopeptidase [Anaerobacillus sp. MEB173]|uniref:M23 family metallopeptidase n=1 Tax=Anaerobacillus sp. MEB173 TaxID=3383345 RepID=UPI003F91F5C7
MKRMIAIITIMFLITLTACQTNNRHEPFNYSSSDETINSIKIPMELKENEARFAVNDLVNSVDGTYQYDDLHRTLTMTIGENKFLLIEGVPVVERNGVYLPNEDLYLIREDNELYLPVAFLEDGLGLTLRFDESNIAFQWHESAQMVSVKPERLTFEDWDVEQMVEYLSFLHKPILDAQVSTIPNHLPGAKRPYRNGYHEGMDWYAYATGSDINRDTPIYAMAEGIVVRADHDFEDYSSVDIRNKDLMLTTEMGETPEYIFDRLRGRQVWVQYENGVMNRFAHLDAIPDSIKVGDKVDEKTIIGYVGNSGTSGAVNQDDTELHLHQDLLIYGELFWKPFTLDEVKEILIRVFEDN